MEFDFIDEPEGIVISIAGLSSSVTGAGGTGVANLLADERLDTFMTYAFDWTQQEEIVSSVLEFSEAYPGASISIIGHSAGTGTAESVVHALNEYGIEVNELSIISAPDPILSENLPDNVDHAVNYYSNDGYFLDETHYQGAENIGFDYSHTEIDDAKDVQGMIIDNINTSTDFQVFNDNYVDSYGVENVGNTDIGGLDFGNTTSYDLGINFLDYPMI